jgi:hypothetical protein
MTDYKIGYMRLADSLNQRYEIPTSILNPVNLSPKMRLEQLGFTINLKPFSFAFTDISNPNNVFVHTRESAFVMMDKYIQMDFQLPS